MRSQQDLRNFKKPDSQLVLGSLEIEMLHNKMNLLQEEMIDLL